VRATVYVYIYVCTCVCAPVYCVHGFRKEKEIDAEGCWRYRREHDRVWLRMRYISTDSAPLFNLQVGPVDCAP